MNLQNRIDWISERVRKGLGRRGAVVQTSGGIDSSVALALCALALGVDNVIALFLPDTATNPESYECAKLAANHAGVSLLTEDISAITSMRNDIYNEIVARYDSAYDPEIEGTSLNINSRALRELGIQTYSLAIGPLHGRPSRSHRIKSHDLRALISIQNRKQRYRMLCAYEVAERHGYAVAGASNRDELDTGFVVKYGDDAADICVLGDLSKTQVYRVAQELDIPIRIINRAPTTDTFSLSQTQAEYYLPSTESFLPDELNSLSSSRAAHLTYLSIRSERWRGDNFK